MCIYFNPGQGARQKIANHTMFPTLLVTLSLKLTLLNTSGLRDLFNPIRIKKKMKMDTGDSRSLDPSVFKRLAPSQFISFSFPNPSQDPYPYSDVLRVAVLDSPLLPSLPPPRVAAMLVPIGRESDWIFCTATGHLQLLLSSSSSSQDLFLSRLILVGNFPISSCPLISYTRLQSEPDFSSLHHFQEALCPLLLALCPMAAFKNGVPEIPFLSYEDKVVRSVMVERIEGSVFGEMLVEDVEIDVSPAPELRRRLRFKMMPNLVQTQVRLIPDPSKDGSICPQKGSLVQPYLAPMVAGLSLVAPFLEEQIKLGLRPRALCLGVGGGALLMFLQSKLDFDVLGVEADPVVLNIARQHFGLVEGEFLHVHVGDGIGFIKNVAQQEKTLIRLSDLVEGSRMDFDVIMVDLDAGDAVNGASAPPLEFVQRNVLLAAKMVLHDRGIIVINVIPQSKAFYSELIHYFREVFAELYEIEVGNGENYVLVATVTNVQLSLNGGSCGSWLQNLRLVIGEKHISSINKL